MQYNTAKIKREINAQGVEYEKSSAYERFCKLTDLRSVLGKRYEFAAMLTIIVLAKFCGEDKPFWRAFCTNTHIMTCVR